MTEPATTLRQLPVGSPPAFPPTQVDSDSSETTRVPARGATIYYHVTPDVSSTTNTGQIANGLSINVPGNYYFATASGVRASIDVITSMNTTPGSVSSSILGGRPIVVTRTADNYALDAGAFTAANPGIMSKIAHTFTAACADIRLFFAEPVQLTDIDIAGSVGFHVGFEVPGGSVIPVTFQGNAYGRIDPGSGGVLSDPVPYEFAVGDVGFSRVYQFAPGGPETTLAALSSIGDQTLSLTDPLMPNGGYHRVDTSGNVELVEIVDYTGSGPYVHRLRRKMTVAHANGVVINQHKIANILLQGRFNDLAGNGQTDQSQSGTVAALAATNTALSADTLIGDTTLTMAAAQYATTLTVDTAGNAETVTVRSVTGASTPFKVYLTSALTKNHTSGVAISCSTTYGAGFGPTAVVADRLLPTGAARKKTVYLTGDSIIVGTGDLTMPSSAGGGYVARALLNVIPFIALGRAGESAQQFATVAISRRRKLTLSTADWMIYEYGVNDIYGGRTLAQFETDSKTIWNWARNRGLKIAACTLSPRTTSSDDFQTGAGQTIANSSFNTVRQTYNNNLRTGAYSPWVDFVIDAVAPIEANAAGVVTAAGDYWKADASGPYTVDGIHPSFPGHILMSAIVNPAIFV